MKEILKGGIIGMIAVTSCRAFASSCLSGKMYFYGSVVGRLRCNITVIVRGFLIVHMLTPEVTSFEFVRIVEFSFETYVSII